MSSHKKQRILIPFLLSLVLFLSNSCAEKSRMKEIEKSGELTVLTINDAHCYYIYQNKQMGFEYDLAKAFADYLGVTLKIQVTEWKNLLREISEGRGSRVRVILNDVKAVFHRPHPERVTEKGAVKSVRRFLKEAGVIS